MPGWCRSRCVRMARAASQNLHTRLKICTRKLPNHTPLYITAAVRGGSRTCQVLWRRPHRPHGLSSLSPSASRTRTSPPPPPNSALSELRSTRGEGAAGGAPPPSAAARGPGARPRHGSRVTASALLSWRRLKAKRAPAHRLTLTGSGVESAAPPCGGREAREGAGAAKAELLGGVVRADVAAGRRRRGEPPQRRLGGVHRSVKGEELRVAQAGVVGEEPVHSCRRGRDAPLTPPRGADDERSASGGARGGRSGRCLRWGARPTRGGQTRCRQS